MVIDKNTAGPVKALWHTMIDVKSGALASERFSVEDLVLQVHKNPALRGNDGVVYVPWAVSVWKGDEAIAILAIEEDDLRGLADAFGCSVKELQAERGTKGFFGNPVIVAYAGSKREELDPYQGKQDLKTVEECLLEWACDTVDVMGDPKKLS